MKKETREVTTIDITEKDVGIRITSTNGKITTVSLSTNERARTLLLDEKEFERMKKLFASIE